MSMVPDGRSTQGLQCSSFLVMTYFLLRDYNILPKRELPLSPWVLLWEPCQGPLPLRVARRSVKPP